MDLTNFRHDIRSASLRSETLGNRASKVGRTDPFLEQALAELSTALAELDVAADEIGTQADQVAEVRWKLERERRRYEELFEFAPAGLLVTDRHGNVLDANRAALELFGFERAHLRGKAVPVLAAEEQRAAIRLMLAALGDGRSRFVRDHDVRMLRRGGEAFDAAITIAPIETADREVVGLRWSVRDVTTRRAMETELRHAKENLEREVERRTAQLAAANDRLRRELAEKEALEARIRAANDRLAGRNSELESFAYHAAHDLKAPLRNVIAYLDLRLRRGATSDQLISQAACEAKAMVSMIDSFLDYCRLGADGIEISEVDLGGLVHCVVDRFRGEIAAAGAEIRIGDLPRTSGSALLLEHLFQNLVSNALKFRGPEPPRIEIGADEGAVFVRDNGIGIPADHREEVFGPFRRLHHPEEFPGNGLDLALAKRVVDLHGGRIWIESTPGEGTTFRVQLPDRIVAAQH